MAALDFSRPVLVLEAATSAGSVALLLPSGDTPAVAVPMGAGAADGLFPAITALLRAHAVDVGALGAVVCGAGPGSFTSLRIAAALAKGIAHGAGRPLYAVPSLALAAAALPSQAEVGAFLVHADALRGERYALEVVRDASGQVSWSEAPRRRSIDDLREASVPLVSVGPSPAALTSAYELWPEASAARRADGRWREAPVDLRGWEPLYGRLAEAQVKWEASHGRPLPDVRDA
ncbi:MAG: tRNA (adenosine(37)-N6)-threonylcarbamoyltransferase complex dimerization subunit type 1 TsaB [Gemmatimonadaceae bacterium]|nr:tRNA (adenosine(37)-N6)-threonylcarbamoyltransferase complex dimerization subunit type 1 TsaB [Gemmatimonadaceae bacterium]